VPSGAAQAARRLPAAAKLAMSRHPYPSTAALLDDCAACAADQIIAEAGGPAWDADGFAKLLARTREALPSLTAGVVTGVADALTAAQEVASGLDAATSPVLAPAAADIRAQLSALIHPGFVTQTGAARLRDLPRYLRACVQRLAKAAQSPARDAELMAAVHRAAQDWQEALALVPPGSPRRAEVREVRWLIEELRVSLFAQTLGTKGPVSERRIRTTLDRLTAR
jgi:ATP-dependent helicase HrpA